MHSMCRFFIGLIDHCLVLVLLQLLPPSILQLLVAEGEEEEGQNGIEVVLLKQIGRMKEMEKLGHNKGMK